MANRNTLQINVLGDLQVVRGVERVPLPPSKKTRALLGYLVLTGRPHRRDRLCSLLWDVADDPRGALRWSLSKLRPLVDEPGAERIATDREHVWFESQGATVDAIEARRSLQDGTEGVGAEDLRAVVDGFRGVLLEGLELTDFHEFHAWCVGQREEFRALQARALHALVGRLSDDPSQALPHARTLVQLDPLDEIARANLVRLLVATGRRDEAEQQVESGQRQMRELGVEPSGRLATAWREVGSIGRESSPVDSSPISPRQTPWPEPLIVDDSPLVGRQDECRRLRSLLDTVTETRQERAVMVTGEPGVGKTRLMAAFLALVRERGGVVLDGQAYEAESGRPYGPWVDALRRIPAASVDDDLAARLARLRPDLATPPDEQSRSELFSAVVELIGACARAGRPVAVAIDDVQWLDAASVELLHYAARMSRSQPLVVMLAARRGELVDNVPMQRLVRSLGREQTLEEIELNPLSRDETEALVASVAPQREADDVYAQSAGNPLFTLELARAGPRIDGERPSSTLTDLVRERVERLPPACADVLRWCATFGHTAQVTHLSALTALSTEELMRTLERLERHGLLRAEAGAYAFSHDVVRQVMYAELSEPRRRLMHHRIAQELVGSEPEGDAVTADIARHAALGGDAAMAAGACITAGRRCLWLFANVEAATLARRGMHYADGLPEPERTTTMLDLLDIQLAAVSPSDAEHAAEELEHLAERALDHGCLEHARLGFHLLSYLRWEGGAQSDAARHMLHAEQVTRGMDGEERVVALAEAARCLVLLDRDLGDAEALALEARAIAVRTGVVTPAIADAIGMLRAHQGELDEAARRFREAADRGAPGAQSAGGVLRARAPPHAPAPAR